MLALLQIGLGSYTLVTKTGGAWKAVGLFEVGLGAYLLMTKDQPTS